MDYGEIYGLRGICGWCGVCKLWGVGWRCPYKKMVRVSCVQGNNLWPVYFIVTFEPFLHIFILILIKHNIWSRKQNYSCSSHSEWCEYYQANSENKLSFQRHYMWNASAVETVTCQSPWQQISSHSQLLLGRPSFASVVSWFEFL